MHSSIWHSSGISFASVFTNRLVLNLKRAGNSHMQHEASTLPSLAFATNSFVGNLGAPFRVNNEDGGDEEPQMDSSEHEMRERNREGKGTLMVEDA